jgi:hypothetical protein
MEATVDPQPRGPDWMPITPKTESLFHADSQRASLRMIEAIEADFAAVKTELLKGVFEYKADAEREIERRAEAGHH